MLITYNASKLTNRTTSRLNSRVRICIRITLRDIAAEEERRTHYSRERESRGDTVGRQRSSAKESGRAAGRRAPRGPLRVTILQQNTT